MTRTALVSGGSSGLGLATARALRAQGFTVYTLSRREFSEEGLTHIRCDVSSEAECGAAVAGVLAGTGRLDLLVNCAGFGISGAAEFTEDEDAHRLMEVDLFGAVRLTRAALGPMRAQGGGRIVNVGSVAGSLPIPFQAWYTAAKAALDAWTGAVANEVRPFGIRMTCILPGDTATGFTAAREKSPEGDAVYGGRISRSVTRMEKDERNGTDPALSGRAIARIAMKKHLKVQYTLGAQYRLFIVLGRLLPARFVSWGLRLMYAK